MKEWIVFYHNGKEILAITVDGLMCDEIINTKELLAYERGISPDEITIKVGKRGEQLICICVQ